GTGAGLRTAVYDHGLWIAIAGNAPQTRLLISSDGLNWITHLTSNVHIAQIAPLGAELVGISPPARYNRTRWFPPAVVKKPPAYKAAPDPSSKTSRASMLLFTPDPRGDHCPLLHLAM
ncbi:MAG: hypothetical protein ACNA8P_01310, partial [Phycisphaerales bacterium]